MLDYYPVLDDDALYQSQYNKVKVFPVLSSYDLILNPVEGFKVKDKKTGITVLANVPGLSWLTLSGTLVPWTEHHGNFNVTVVTPAPYFTTTEVQVMGLEQRTRDEVMIKLDVLTTDGMFFPVVFVVSETPAKTITWLASCFDHPFYTQKYFFKNRDYEHFEMLTKIIFASHNDHDKYGGLGLQYSVGDFAGHRIPLTVGEQGVGRGQQPLTDVMDRQHGGAGGTMYSSYAPVPMYVTDGLMAGYVSTTNPTWLDLTRKERIVWETVGLADRELYGPIAGGVLFEGKGGDMYGLMKKVTEITGRFRKPPKWSYGKGAIVGVQGGEDVVLGKIKKLKDGGVPVAGIWIQDWAGKRVDSFGSRVLWNWELDTVRYPNWEKMLKTLRDEDGTRVLAYVNPYVSTQVDEFKPHANRNLFEEAKHYGFLVKHMEKCKADDKNNNNNNNNNNNHGSNNNHVKDDCSRIPLGKRPGDVYIQSSASSEFKFATIDLSNPSAVTWFVDVVIRCNLLCECGDANERWLPIKPVTDKTQAVQCGNGGDADVAVGGWMADFGEYLPFDIEVAGSSLMEPVLGTSYHSKYPAVWAGVNSQAIADRDVLFFSRAGGLTSPKMGTNGGMFWVGDQNASFDEHDGLASALVAALNGGLSGITLTHSDVGGYTSINVVDETTGTEIVVARSEELMLRWMELSAFADSMFRSHEGNKADKELQVWDNPRLIAGFAKWAKFHAKLAPLREILMDDAAENGWPLVRGMCFDYGVTRAWGMKEQFMLGKGALVAPVLKQGERTVKVWLPKGTKWVHFWSCKAFEPKDENGEWVTVAAEIGEPGLFLPMNANSHTEFFKAIWREMDMCGEYSARSVDYVELVQKKWEDFANGSKAKYHKMNEYAAQLGKNVKRYILGVTVGEGEMTAEMKEHLLTRALLTGQTGNKQKKEKKKTNVEEDL